MMDEVRTCRWCGAEFTVDASDGRSRKRKTCSENCRKRDCDDRHRKACMDCGAEMGPRSGYSRPRHLRCWPCELRRREESHAGRDQQIVVWWAEGLSLNEIAGRLGWSTDHLTVEIHRLRERGYDLPYRYRGYGDRFPDQRRAA